MTATTPDPHPDNDTLPRWRSRYAVLDEIKRLDPERDHVRIAYLSGSYDFPFDTQRSLELALLRTFAVPRSSELMVDTGEFVTRTQKRYDDTTILISAIGFYGYDSPEGRRAIRRMNQIHRHYPIPNHEFLYVLTTFVFEPIRWNAKFGWRLLHEHEKLASYYFWREVGRRMNIRDIPDTVAGLEHYNRSYEAEHFAYSPHNQKLAEATRDLFLGWVLPKPLWRYGAYAVYAVMDDAMLDAFGFPRPPAWLRYSIGKALRLRGAAARLLPPRRTPYRLPPTRSYPGGVALEEVGPDRPVAPPQNSAP